MIFTRQQLGDGPVLAHSCYLYLAYIPLWNSVELCGTLSVCQHFDTVILDKRLCLKYDTDVQENLKYDCCTFRLQCAWHCHSCPLCAQTEPYLSWNCLLSGLGL